jgi:hypothetical protein
MASNEQHLTTHDALHKLFEELCHHNGVSKDEGLCLAGVLLVRVIQWTNATSGEAAELVSKLALELSNYYRNSAAVAARKDNAKWN